MPPRAGLFLVLEGPDKSGKSTQAALLVRSLRGRGLDVIHTREPGGTSLAEAVRRILLNPKQNIVPLAELFLYEASRAQHTHETILPALKRGQIVVSERYAMASLAYQGCARGLGLPVVRTLNRVASFGLVPDLTLVLDIPESEFGSRPRGRLDRIEREGSAFRKKVRDAYRSLSRTEPGTVLVNGRMPLEDLRRLILKRVEALLSKTGLHDCAPPPALKGSPSGGGGLRLGGC
ncbi:MAG: dTMP kinase [Elusimicrobia bacterium]|nr:dTMP kinase [Elusimicrobiota bacterium]